MAEEKLNTTTLTNDDLSVLRVILHNIKGISPISTAEGYLPVEVTGDSAGEN